MNLPATQNRNWLISDNKKSKKIYLFLLTLTYLLLGSLSSLKIIAQPVLPCSQNCSAKDVKVKSLELVTLTPGADPTDPTSYVSLPPTCTAGDIITGYLRVNLSVTASDRYTFLIAGELWVDDVHISASDPYQCYSNSLAKGEHTLVISSNPIQWTCGSKLEVRNAFTAWGNSSSDNVCTQSCSEISSHCKKYGINETFTVVTSLSANFTWTGQCEGGALFKKIYFDAVTSSGGTRAATGIPYKSYQWDFENDGIFDETSTTSTTTNHIYPAAGTYTVKLRVTDQNDVTNDFFDDVEVETCCQPPTISGQPQSVSKCSGSSASFTAAATGGNPTTTVQWQLNISGTWTDLADGGVYSGVTTTTLGISDVTGLNSNQYRAVFTSGTCTAANTNAATLTVNTAPVVTTAPSSTTKCSGAAASFTVAYTDGSPAAAIQWQVYNTGSSLWDNLTNAGVYSTVTTATLNISNVAGLDGKQYRAALTSGECAAVNSAAAILTVNTAPVVTTAPSPTTKCSGTAATFTVGYTDGSPAAAIQWQVYNTGTSLWDNLTNTGVYTNVNTATLNISNVAGLNGKQYRAALTSGECAVVNSGAATLTVNTAPVVTGNPSPATKCSGEAASFNVTYTDGTPAAGIQWQVYNSGTWDNLANIGVYTNVNTATLNISNVAGLNGKLYRAALTSGECAAVNSASAALTVNTVPIVTGNPSGTTKCSGTPATFTVAYTEGSPAAGIQWQLYNTSTSSWDNLTNSGVYSTVTTATLNISDVAGLNGKQYRAVLTSGVCGAVNSGAATLTVIQPISVTLPPQNVTVTYGAASAGFSITASNVAGYQWQKTTPPGSTFANMLGETTSSITVNNPTVAMSGTQYKVNLTANSPCSPTDRTATLTVNPAQLCLTYNGLTFGVTNNASPKCYVDNGGKIRIILTVVGSPVADISTAVVKVSIAGSVSNQTATYVAAASGNAAYYWYDWTVPCLASTSQSEIWDVSWTVGGNYTTAGCTETTALITISAPTLDFTTGGGYIFNNLSKGTIGIAAGETPSKNNYGFNLKWGNNMKILQGNINTIIRQGGKQYQVKSNKPTYLFTKALTPYTIGTKTYNPYEAVMVYENAVFKNLTDGTGEGGGPTSLVYLRIVDNGEPNSAGTPRIDQISILFKQNNVVKYSSREFTVTNNPAVINLMDIVKGNLQVHVAGAKPNNRIESDQLITESPVKTVVTGNNALAINPQAEISNTVLKLAAVASPNPYRDQVQFSIESNVSGRGVLEVYNLLGQKIQTVFDGNVFAGKSQLIQYNVPAQNRTTLMYRLKVGDQVISGKLLRP